MSTSQAPSSSLVRRLMVGLTLAVGLSSAVVVALSAVHDMRVGEVELERSADASISHLAGILQHPLWELDMAAASNIGEAFAQDPRIVRLSIREAETGESYAMDRGHFEDVVRRVRKVEHEGRVLGEVEIALSRTGYREQVLSRVFMGLVVGLISLLAGFASVGFLVRHLLRRPLDDLSRVVSAYARGSYPSSPVVTPYLEFQAFCAVLYEMGKKIEANVSEVRKNRNMLAKVIDSVPQGIFWKDVTGAYLGCNAVFARSAGLDSPEAVIGKTDFQLWPDEHTERYRAADKQVIDSAKGQYHMVEPLMQADGVSLWVDTTKVPLMDEQGRIYAVLGVFEDITQRKLAEEELRRHKDHLEDLVRSRTDELSHRNRELELAAQAAEAANQAKSTFLSNMSHELRTPLNAILGHAHLMDLDAEASPAQKQRLSVILRSGAHLLTLINDVLDLAKIEAGKVELERTQVDVFALARELCDMLRVRAEEKGLRLVLEGAAGGEGRVVSDAAKLRQILTNLVGNAIKFTHEGQVTVRIGLTGQEGEPPTLFLEVEDTGVGIAASDVERIFHPFEQVGGTSRVEGTGLGLAITRQQVARLGGSLTVHSEPGRGSCFRVSLPVTRGGEHAKGAALPGEERRVVGLLPGQPAWRVLVVEDHAESRAFLCALLENVGFTVTGVDTAERALEVLEGAPFDFVWMDWRLPGIDGSEATRRIRAMDGGQRIRIVGLTASVFVREREALLAAGFDDVVLKPVKPAEVFDVMARLLGARYRFVSERPGPARAARELSPRPAELLTVSPALRAELRSALLTLDAQRIAAAVERVARDHPALGDKLNGCISQFAYSSLLSALDACPDTVPSSPLAEAEHGS